MSIQSTYETNSAFERHFLVIDEEYISGKEAEKEIHKIENEMNIKNIHPICYDRSLDETRKLATVKAQALGGVGLLLLLFFCIYPKGLNSNTHKELDNNTRFFLMMAQSVCTFFIYRYIAKIHDEAGVEKLAAKMSENLRSSDDSVKVFFYYFPRDEDCVKKAEANNQAYVGRMEYKKYNQNPYNGTVEFIKRKIINFFSRN